MMAKDLPPLIGDEERQARLSRLRAAMQAEGTGAILLGPDESLRYFTGLVWHQSERLLAAVVTPTALYYVVPAFEESRVESLPHLPGEIRVWQEEEDSAALVASLVGPGERLAVDDALPLFVHHALVRRLGAQRLVDGGALIRDQRLHKSPAEIALIRCAMDLTL